MTLPIGTLALAFYDIDMQHVVESGELTVMVGTCSRGAYLQRVTLTVE